MKTIKFIIIVFISIPCISYGQFGKNIDQVAAILVKLNMESINYHANDEMTSEYNESLSCLDGEILYWFYFNKKDQLIQYTISGTLEQIYQVIQNLKDASPLSDKGDNMIYLTSDKIYEVFKVKDYNSWAIKVLPQKAEDPLGLL